MSDAHGMDTFLNKGWLDFVGRSLEEEIGRGWEESIHPDDRDEVIRAFEGALASESNYEMEYRLRHRDGSYRWITELGIPRYDDEGRFEGLTGAAFDITARKEAEAALERRDAILQAVSGAAERLLAAPFSEQAAARFLAELGEAADASRSYAFEHTPAEDGTPLHTLYLEWCAPGVQPAAELSELDHIPYFDGWEERLPRGEIINVHVRTLPSGARDLLEPQGTKSLLVVPVFAGTAWWGFLGFDECRTEREWSAAETEALKAAAGILGAAFERRRAEEALRESELRFRQFADHVDEGFWLDSPVTGKILYLNKAFEEIWGRPREEIYADGGRAIRAGVHPEDQPVVFPVFDRYAEEPYDLQFRIVRPDGTVRWVRDRSFLVRDGTGNVVRIAGVTLDITEILRAANERRALEEQMRHAQKLESLGVLAGGIAHDFNNLLMGILGNAGLARSELPPGSPASGTVEQIEIAALRAAELTNQMLAYAGKGRFVIEPLDLSQLVEEMAHLLSAAISKKAVLRYDLMAGLPAVEGDATQLRQVVMNLIINASEALGDESGVITVRTGAMEADRAYLAATWAGESVEPGRFVYLEVADTGCGMDEAARSRIFDPFFTTKFTGRGLGLAGVLGIVRSHHGAIRVDSKPHEGTRMQVLLPTVVRAAGTGEILPEPAVADDEVHATVLVVDDEETVRAVARAVLERAGFSVFTAGDGREGLNVFRAHADEIDAVLLDLTMPTMGGPEVLTELGSMSAGARVILSSGYTEEDARNRIPEERIAGFIQKPYRPGQLVEKVREVLAS
jgi:PAS domain S-box-containing protein